ncbi:hypothetical protein LshimejAT787_0804500 [Lyophyllum shimeji]|uniref:Uncharacterized protein n=1 Tax=Lyophyllum shimeji TaxID=47721 RepID=A0A9P3PS64_LYOSH|nr:hypothetical protein LshimejAT787_0804500 [Lyophyllum shimeji]
MARTMDFVRRITRARRSRTCAKETASLDPTIYHAPQPGEDFTPVLPDDILPLDSTDLAGGSESFTNYRVLWRGRIVTVQQFHEPRARESFQEHLDIIHSLRDCNVPVRWVAGVSTCGAQDDPFIIYNAQSIWNDLKPLVKASLERYSQIPQEKRAAEYEVWSRANNIDNFFRHLDPASFRKILD